MRTAPNYRTADTLPPVTDEHVIPWSELAGMQCGFPPAWSGGPGVLLPELAEWARVNGVTIRQHWAGGPGLSPSDAHRVLVAYQRAQASDRADQAAYREYVEEQARLQYAADRDAIAQARRDAEARYRATDYSSREAAAQAAEDHARAVIAERRLAGPGVLPYDTWRAKHARRRATTGGQ